MVLSTEHLRKDYNMDKYKIIRMFADETKSTRTIKKGLTLEEAQAHCQDPTTSEAGVWFDAYTDQT
jgi:hypothetical protein